MSINRQFIGWKEPPVIEFSRLLKEEICPGRAFDDLLIWVPSSRAARHLESELFLDVAPLEAFHPPTCVTPAQYFHQLAARAEVASPSQCLYAWKQAIKGTDIRVLDAIFPGIKSYPGDEWAYEIAQQFIEMRQRLAEENFTFAGMAELPGLPDLHRWSALRNIESEYFTHIESANLNDPDEYIDAHLTRIVESFPSSRLLLMGILNLSRRQETFIRALERAGVPIDIYIPCDARHSDKFDAFGRPSSEAWTNMPIAAVLLQDVVHRVPSPREAIPQIIQLSRSYGTSTDALVLGTPDDEYSEYLINLGNLSQSEYYSPAGKPLIDTVWGKLISGALRWKSGKDLDALSELLNHSLFRRWMEGRGTNVAAVQNALNLLKKEHLFSHYHQLADTNLGPLGEVATVRKHAENIDELLDYQKDNTITESIWNFLNIIAQANELTDELQETLGLLAGLIEDLHKEIQSGSIPHADQFKLVESQLKSARFYPERVIDQRPVVGWLELSWEIAPHLVILGLSDSSVPGTFSTDTFLTPALCRKHGFHGPDEEAAVHAFRLNLILHARKNRGRLDVILTDRDLAGDPVLPCRFLFQSKESESLKRINGLLGERVYDRVSHPRDFGAKLRIPEPETLNSMSITGFAAYLKNPIQFLLERRFRWEPPGPVFLEMDPLKFGNLAHRVLQSLNLSEEGSRLMTAEDIFAFLQDEVEKQMILVFGSNPGVPLQIQKSSLLERMRAASEIISDERKSGWMPHKVEWAFHNETEFLVDGVKLRGKIDLLEKNTESGAYRIIDYKTSDKNESPQKTHIQALNAGSRAPLIPGTDFSIGERMYRWKDLQLPLYQVAVEQSLGIRPECAYVCLGKAVKDVCLDEWTPEEAHSEAAIKCASAVIRCIREGYYPLPDSISRYDLWAGWFGYDYQHVIDPEWIHCHAEGLMI